MRRWILKGTTLKTPFHIALFQTQITLHFFQVRISTIPEIGDDLFLAISKTGMCSLNVVNFRRFTILVPSWPRFEKVGFITFFKVR